MQKRCSYSWYRLLHPRGPQCNLVSGCVVSTVSPNLAAICRAKLTGRCGATFRCDSRSRYNTILFVHLSIKRHLHFEKKIYFISISNSFYWYLCLNLSKQSVCRIHRPFDLVHTSFGKSLTILNPKFADVCVWLRQVAITPQSMDTRAVTADQKFAGSRRKLSLLCVSSVYSVYLLSNMTKHCIDA